MAPSAKHFALLFLLALLSFKLTQARQSQFFSKVATTTATANAKDTVQVPDNQPNFIRDSQTGYGLYDHGTGQLPPETDTSKTPTSFPYTATDVQPDTRGTERLMDQGYPATTYNDDFNNNNEYVNEQQGLSDTSLMDQSYPTTTYNDDFNSNNNEYVNEQQGLSGTSLMDRRSPTAYDNQAYVTKPEGYKASNNGYEYANEQQGFSGTSLMDRRSPTAYNNQAYVSNPNGYNYNDNDNGVNAYNSQLQDEGGEVLGEEKYLGEYNNNKNTNYYNKVNNAGGYNGQRQGMSDTRFMENGRYYYDVKNEYNYNPNGNSMEGYQNQVSGDGFNP